MLCLSSCMGKPPETHAHRLGQMHGAQPCKEADHAVLTTIHAHAPQCTPTVGGASSGPPGPQSLLLCRPTTRAVEERARYQQLAGHVAAGCCCRSAGTHALSCCCQHGRAAAAAACTRGHRRFGPLGQHGLLLGPPLVLAALPASNNTQCHHAG